MRYVALLAVLAVSCASYAESDRYQIDPQHLTVGFLVDRVQEVIRVERSIIEPPPELVTSINTRYITGVAKLDDRLLILLDLERVLTTSEQERPAMQQAKAA